MRRYFADTSYYVALLVPRDCSHEQAHEFARATDFEAVTSEHVLLELSAFFAKPPHRHGFVTLIDRLRRTPEMTIVPATTELFEQGLNLYRAHSDKSWSLTDCISFAIMRDQNINAALTADHHFEQAGFTALMTFANP